MLLFSRIDSVIRIPPEDAQKRTFPNPPKATWPIHMDLIKRVDSLKLQLKESISCILAKVPYLKCMAVPVLFNLSPGH